ncbi:MAG: hypothetical protein ACI8U3_001776 [Brevundimonas sp.]|jgi:hypothetical protein|uniref:hypothetical protein n=1 Tax=Brevundimonas sp. TaxID=1871086 RepID=UPI0039E58400
MRRRDLIAAGTVLVASATAAAAAAPSSDAPPEAVTLNLVPLGLPVITEGRLRNYVFVNLRLLLASGQTAEAVRPHDPFIRDALVKAAHRVDFSAGGDWTRLNERMLTAATMAAARVVAGDGVVTSVEVQNQAPRRRTGMRPN